MDELGWARAITSMQITIIESIRMIHVMFVSYW